MSAPKAEAVAAKEEALAAVRRGDVAIALVAAERAIAADDTYAEGWAARGTVKLIQGDAAGAEDDLAHAVDLKPLLAEAHLNRAMALTSLGRLDAAEQALVQVRTADPRVPVDVCFKRLIDLRRAAFEVSGARGDGMRLAVLLSAAGLLADADAVLARCLEQDPNDAELWALRGDVALRQQRFNDAEIAARHAARAKPDDVDLATNIAGVKFAAGDAAGAIAEARAVAQKFPQSCRAWIQLADLLGDDFNEGAAAVMAAAQTPDATSAAVSRAIWAAAERCEWDAGEALLTRLLQNLNIEAANPLRLMLLEADPMIVRRNAEKFVSDTIPARRPFASAAVSKPKLRIGYLSPDFRDNHPVATTMIDLLRHHDRAKFEIYAYAIGPQSSGAPRAAIAAAVDHFTPLSELSDIEAAKCIQADGIDILIDLAGHTQHSRLGILAFRPAPLQLHYLGYPGTTGAPFIDYLVGDPWTVPPSSEAHFCEAIIRMPHTYLVNSHRPGAASGWDRARFGFGEDDIILCSFNHPHKITRSLFDAWAAILRGVPRAVLWLRADNQVAIANLTHAIEAKGLAAHRLRFAPRVEFAVHLARYGVAELMLDTSPYNAHTTAADALWMGCPVLTLPGATFASRVCAGLVDAAGLDDLIAVDLDDYVAKGIALASDRTARAELRDRLVGVREGVLFDVAAFARAFEAGLLMAWKRTLSGQSTITVDVHV